MWSTSSFLRLVLVEASRVYISGKPTVWYCTCNLHSINPQTPLTPITAIRTTVGIHRRWYRSGLGVTWIHISDMDEAESHLHLHQTPHRVPRIRTTSVPSQLSPRANGLLKSGRRPISPLGPSFSSHRYALGGQTRLRLIDQSSQ